MERGAATSPVVPRVLPGGEIRGLAAPGACPAFTSSWGAVRATQLRLEPGELPEGCLVNHLVAMNLGGEARFDANVGGRGWETHQAPHHGLTVIPAELPYASRARQAADLLLVELQPDFVADVVGAASTATALPVVLGARDPFAEHVLLALAHEARRGSRSATPCGSWRTTSTR